MNFLMQTEMHEICLLIHLEFSPASDCFFTWLLSFARENPTRYEPRFAESRLKFEKKQKAICQDFPNEFNRCMVNVRATMLPRRASSDIDV